MHACTLRVAGRRVESPWRVGKSRMMKLMLHDANGTWESAWCGVGPQRSGAGFLVHQSCHFSHSSRNPACDSESTSSSLARIFSRLIHDTWTKKIDNLCIVRTLKGETIAFVDYFLSGHTGCRKKRSQKRGKETQHVPINRSTTSHPPSHSLPLGPPLSYSSSSSHDD